jgi:hypothetical protein
MKKKRLSIVLNTTFLLGPIRLALLGFGVSVKLEKGGEIKQKTLMAQSSPMYAAGLGSLPVSNTQVTLEGLMVSFDRPPLTIAE